VKSKVGPVSRDSTISMVQVDLHFPERHILVALAAAAAAAVCQMAVQFLPLHLPV
jgi:hypothetical protein